MWTRTPGGPIATPTPHWAVFSAVILTAPLWLFGCEKGETVAVDLRGVTADVAVVLTLDAQQSPVRVSAPFGLRDGAVTFGFTPNWTLEEEREATMIAVGLDDSALASIYGKYGARPAMPSLRLTAPPDSPRLDPNAALEEPWLEAGVGSAAFVVPAGGPAGQRISIDDYPAVQAGLRLRLPVDAEPCAPRGERRLYPFGAEVDGILDPAGLQRWQQILLAVARLDDRTALVGGPGLYVVTRGERARRGQPEPTGPDVWVPFDRLWPGSRGGQAKAVSLLPAGIDGVRRGVVAVEGFDPDRSWLHEITFGPSGVQFVQTLIEVDGVNIEDVDVDDQLRIAAISEAGRVLIGSLTSDDFTWYDIESDINDGYAVRWTEQPNSPVVVGVDRAVLVGNPELGTWGRRDISLVGESSPVSELAVLRERNEVWAAGSRGLLMVRSPLSEWDQVGLELPPRFLECAVPDTRVDQLRTLRNVDALAGGDGYVYLSQENCNAVVALRIEDRCTTVLTPDGGLARIDVQQDESDKQLRAATYEAGQLLMVGDEGRVLTNLPPEN